MHITRKSSKKLVFKKLDFRLRKICQVRLFSLAMNRFMSENFFFILNFKAVKSHERQLFWMNNSVWDSYLKESNIKKEIPIQRCFSFQYDFLLSHKKNLTVNFFFKKIERTQIFTKFSNNAFVWQIFKQRNSHHSRWTHKYCKSSLHFF